MWVGGCKHVPSSLTLTAVHGNGCRMTRWHVRTRSSHSRAVQSSDPLASAWLPDGQHELTSAVWPL